MSSNVFSSPSAMTAAAAAAAALGDGHYNNMTYVARQSSVEAQSHHHHQQSSSGTMLFAGATPVAGTPVLGMSANSPTTAFPFPPPSSLFLSSLNLLQGPPSSLPWLAPPLHVTSSAGKSLLVSDNNNNDLSSHHLSPAKSKFHNSENNESHRSKSFSNLFETRDKKESWPSLDGSDGSLGYSNGSISPQMDKSNRKQKDGGSSGSAFKSAMLMPTYGSPSISSPTYPSGMSSGSPHTPNQAHFGPTAHYPSYLLPGLPFPYYGTPTPHSSGPSSFSPPSSTSSGASGSQSQTSPISSFLVPNLTPAISNSSTAAFAAPDSEQPSKENSQPRNQTSSQVIDLAPSRPAEVDSPARLSSSTKTSESSGSNLKRKSPVEPEESANKSNGSPNLEEQSNSGGNSTSGGSRKQRILKPPNINLGDCSELRNGLSSAFLPSPLYPQPLSSSHLPSSPYTYLDHIPLSAPPIPQAHNSMKCFDFSAAMPSDPNLTSRLSTTNPNKDLSLSLHLMSQLGHQSSFKPFSSSSSKQSETHTSESKVTFQIPHPVDKGQSENLENGHKEKSLLNLKKASVSNTSKRSSLYPEYFRKGSAIKLGNGSMKKVEEISTDDFIESASMNGRFKVELSEVTQIKERSKKGFVRIVFRVGLSQVKVSLDSPLEHPFFVYHKGWSSCSPSATNKRYGLSCHRLGAGDVVVTLSNKPNAPPAKNSLASSNFKPPRSLPSSSGSLSSSSSKSSSASSLTNGFFNNPAQLGRPLSKCPPPAHPNKTSHQSALHNQNDLALNLGLKSKERWRSEEEDEEIDVERVDDEASHS